MLSLGRAVSRMPEVQSLVQAKSSSIDSCQNGTFADYYPKTNNLGSGSRPIFVHGWLRSFKLSL